MDPKANKTRRLAHMRQAMAHSRLDAVLVSDLKNVRYLSGFSGHDTALLIARRSQYIVTDFRYFEQAKQEAPEFQLLKAAKGLMPTVARKVNSLHVKTLGFQARVMSVATHRKLKRELKRARLKPVADLVETLRLVKDDYEMACIRQAIKAAETAYRATVRKLQPGMSEREIAAELECQMRRAGADKASFDLIVACQQRASLPHAQPTDAKLAPGRLLLFDWGALAGGYNSDSTRVVFCGKAPKKFQAIYRIVLDAQLAAIDKVAPGVSAQEVDSAARDIITNAGYGECFGHSTGHGVGLDIHEGPRIGQRSHTKLQQGMVFTVEPGIYIPGEGGIRIEDMVRVGKQGAEVITSLPKGLEDAIISARP